MTHMPQDGCSVDLFDLPELARALDICIICKASPEAQRYLPEASPEYAGLLDTKLGDSGRPVLLVKYGFAVDGAGKTAGHYTLLVPKEWEGGGRFCLFGAVEGRPLHLSFFVFLLFFAV